MLVEPTLWSKNGKLLCNTEKDKLIECTVCPCGELVWDILTIGGDYYEITFVGKVVYVDWGDTTMSMVGDPEATTWSALSAGHTYAQAGQYTVRVTGKVRFFGHAEAYRGFPYIARTFTLEGTEGCLQDSGGLYTGFFDCTNLVAIAPGCQFAKSFYTFSHMFCRCSQLSSIPALEFFGERPIYDAPYIDCAYMFANSAIETPPVLLFPSHVYRLILTRMFGGYPLSGNLINTAPNGNVFTSIKLRLPTTYDYYVRMDHMFINHAHIASIDTLTESHVLYIPAPTTTEARTVDIALNNLFYLCSSMTSVPRLIWLGESYNVLNMGYMFALSGITHIESFPLPDVVVSKLDLAYAFANCTSLTEVAPVDDTPVITWPTGYTDQSSAFSLRVSGMFEGCSSLTTFNLVQEADPDSIILTFPPNLASAFNSSSMFAACSSWDEEISVEFPTVVDGAFSSAKMFKGCTVLSMMPSVKFPDDVEGNFTITEMFLECSALTAVTSIQFPECINGHFIGTGVFQQCTSLTDIPTGTSGEKLVFAGDITGDFAVSSMFQGCTSLATVADIDFMYSIGGSFRCVEMFFNCKALNTMGEMTFSLSVPGDFVCTRMFTYSTVAVLPTLITFPATVGGSFDAAYMFGENFVGYKPLMEQLPNIKFPVSVGGSFSSSAMCTRLDALKIIGIIEFPLSIAGDFRVGSMFDHCTNIELLRGWSLPTTIGGSVSYNYFFASGLNRTNFPNGESSSSYCNELCNGQYPCTYYCFFNCAYWLPHGTFPPFWTIGSRRSTLLYGCSNLGDAPSSWWPDSTAETYWNC